MTPLEVYDSFIIKANENAQTDNIAVDKARFSIIYNEAAIKFVEWILEKKNEDDIRYLAPILSTKPLSDISGNSKHQFISLPEDFLDFGSLTAKASGDCCKDIDIELFEIKVDNENTILSDEDNKPDIEYREAPFYLTNGKIKILVDDFKIESAVLTYYKYPIKIKLNDPEDPESGFQDENTNLDFDDKALNRIISIAVSELDLNTGNPKFQADKSRVVSKF